MDIEKIVGSFLDFAGNPVVSVAFSKVGAEIRKRRLLGAQRVLQKKVRAGATWAFRDDEVASAVFDFLRAAEDGAAKRNLDMLAQLVVNGAAEPGLTAEALHHLMGIVAGLSYDEMTVIAAFVRALQRSRVEQTSHPNDPMALVSETWLRVQQELSRTHLGSDGDYYPYAAALQRTGLVIPFSGFGGITFGATALMSQLESLIDFDELNGEAGARSGDR